MNPALTFKISDFGCALYNTKCNAKDVIITRHYRPPEALLGLKCDYSADMWSLGCIIYEILTGDVMFSPRRTLTMSCNTHHIGDFIKVFGTPDQEYLMKCLYSHRYFAPDGKYIYTYEIGNSVSIYKILNKNYKISSKVAKKIHNFLNLIFVWEPEKRILIEDVIKNKFIRYNYKYKI
jgi:serine/threonine-protein kinase SRPK3